MGEQFFPEVGGHKILDGSIELDGRGVQRKVQVYLDKVRQSPAGQEVEGTPPGKDQLAAEEGKFAVVNRVLAYVNSAGERRVVYLDQLSDAQERELYDKLKKAGYTEGAVYVPNTLEGSGPFAAPVGDLPRKELAGVEARRAANATKQLVNG